MNFEFAHKEIEPGMIFLLREMGAADMSRERTDGLAIIHRQDDSIFEWFVVASGKNLYGVTRMGYFAHCTCRAFEYGHHGCKHIAVTLPKVCSHCLERPVAESGGKCSECFHLTEGFIGRSAAPRTFVSHGTL